MMLGVGLEMAHKSLPPEHHVLRYAAYGRCRRDSDENPIGLLPQALLLREGEEYLSVTWQEHFNGDKIQQLHAAVRAVRASMPRMGLNGAFGIGNVGNILKVCKDVSRRTVRILHHPSKTNPGHSGIHQFSDPEQKLLDLMASDIFAEMINNNAVPAK